MCIPRGRAALVDIAHVKNFLRGQQLEVFPSFRVFRVHFDKSRRLALFQHRLRRSEQTVLLGGLFVIALELSHEPLTAFLNALQVREHELSLDDFRIFHRIHAPFDVGYISVFKAAQHMGNRVSFPNIGQKLVAKPLALTCALHKPGNVHKGHSCWNDRL